VSSILKVDTIQTTAGAAPTAKDLGLNVTGNTLNHYYVTASTQTTISNQTFTDIGLSKTLTPVSASSKFYIEYNIFFYGGASVNYWMAMYGRILRDTTQIQVDNYSLGRGGVYMYSSSASLAMQNSHTGYLDSPATASSITYKVQVTNYDSNAPMTVMQGSQQGFLKITEIEG
jgi:hypothetical protein